MANIGSFKKVGNEFQGEIVTLSVQTKGVRIVPGDQPRQRQRPQPSRVRRPGRDRGRLVQALKRGSRLPLGQAGRSELQRADLRQPLRRRGRRGLHPYLVARSQAQRRLSWPSRDASPGPPGEAYAPNARRSARYAQCKRASGFASSRISGSQTLRLCADSALRVARRQPHAHRSNLSASRGAHRPFFAFGVGRFSKSAASTPRTRASLSTTSMPAA